MVMKLDYFFHPPPCLVPLVTGIAALAWTQVATAHPYASGITNNNGTIQFILNEGGGTVDVVFEDQSTNSLGVLGEGPQSFSLGGHTSYALYVTKLGNGTPFQISSDAYTNSIWGPPGVPNSQG